MSMNGRPDMIRQQNMAQLSMSINNSPHFLPNQPQPAQQQSGPNHVAMSNPNNLSMGLLAAGPPGQSTMPHPVSQFDLRRRQLQHQQHQHQQHQQAQNPQMNPSAAGSPAPSHMTSLPQHPLQGMSFPGNMMSQAANNVHSVRRVTSHPQGLNQVTHVPGMHPGQPNMGALQTMNPQNNMPAHLRQASAQPMMTRMPGIPAGSMSPELSITLNRSGNPVVPQNPMRTPSSQPQLMHSLGQPTGLPQGGTSTTMPPNGFPQPMQHSHHPPSITSSSPRPTGPPQGHPANMIMGTPGPSQTPGTRPMNPGDGVFIGMQNPQFNPGFGPAGNRISTTNPSFTPFVPSSSQSDMEMQQHMTDGIPNQGNRGFITPAQPFEHMSQPNDSVFNGSFNMPTQVNGPPRPPSHPTPAAHPSMPPRQPPPPHQHSPHQSDPMAGHVQQQPPRPQSQPQGPPGRPSSQAGPSQTPRTVHSQLPPSNSSGLLASRITPLPQAQTSPHQQRQSTPGQQPIAPRPPQSSTSTAAAPPATAASSSEPSAPPPTIPRPPL
ncbi:hypothetical protein M405DRAFT_411591 [Rhizopogon salebrosus TDB-379]|nr:hypothetical protein M405DRAFT_411591 [Rhizopogon salebrosus TDB-379]